MELEMRIKQKDKKPRPNFGGQFCLLRAKLNTVSDLGGNIISKTSREVSAFVENLNGGQ